MYSIKEIFYTLQGEGINAGRPAVFCRFSGCNLWTGRERDRAKAICSFCDTDFIGTDGPGGGKLNTPNNWPRLLMNAGQKTRPEISSQFSPEASPCFRLIAP